MNPLTHKAADGGNMSDTPRTDVVPGMMRCAKCNFVLVRTNLYVQSSTAGPGGNETEPCPNGCGPLWPLTWEQHARELGERLEQVHADFIVACEEREQRLFPVQGGPSIPWHLIAPWEEQAKRNHDQTLERLAERGGLDTNEAYCVMRGWSFIKIDDAAERLIALISVRSVNVRAEQAESALLACQAREAELVEAIKIGVKEAILSIDEDVPLETIWVGVEIAIEHEAAVALSHSTGSKIMAVVEAAKGLELAAKTWGIPECLITDKVISVCTAYRALEAEHD